MITLFKIDPYTESIYPVIVNDMLTDVCRQVGARRLTIAGQQPIIGGAFSCPDAAYCDDKALCTGLLPPAFRLRSTGHIIYGCALWHRVTDVGKLCTPNWSIDKLIRQVEFLGFHPSQSHPFSLLSADDESRPLDE